MFPQNRAPGPGGKRPGDPPALPPPEVMRTCGMVFGGGSFLIAIIFILIGGSDFNIPMAIVAIFILVFYYQMDAPKNGDPKKK